MIREKDTGPFNFWQTARSVYPHIVFVHSDSMPTIEYNELVRWCEERLGPSGCKLILSEKGDRSDFLYECETDCPWFHVGSRFYFKDETNAFEFKLTWG